MRKNIVITAIVIAMVCSAVAQEWSEPVPVPGINTGATDYYPCISSDGNKLYFTSYRDGNEGIYVSERVNGEWSTPVNLGPPINSEHRDLAPSISADGRTLYFLSWGREGGYGSYDIWYSEWDDSNECWGEIINPGPNINSWAGEWSPCISHDGTKLYFASADYTRPGHLGSDDLYVSERGPDGWQPAINLGINTYGDDYCPSIAADDTTLYFASNDPHEVACWHGPAIDLFVAYFSNGQWGNVQNVCDPVCSDAWERSPSISLIGDTLYFARRSLGDNGDSIYFSVRSTSAIEDNSQPRGIGGFEIKISPNPFNEATNIYIFANHPDYYNIAIYDVMGRLLYSDSTYLEGGEHIITWDGKSQAAGNIASGVLLLVISNSHEQRKEKLIKLK